MTERERKQLSKFLSLVLRHRPRTIDIELDDQGWTDIEVLRRNSAAKGRAFSRAELDEVVVTSDKQRFAISDDGARIRANQGHSVDVDLALDSAAPPQRLFHGTHPGAVDAIRRGGLRKMRRHHVHLSPDRETATKVGGRRGVPIILVVRADAMATAGHTFVVSENGVWLTDHVPPEYIEFP